MGLVGPSEPAARLEGLRDLLGRDAAWHLATVSLMEVEHSSWATRSGRVQSANKW